MSIKGPMSDRASVMKCFNEKLNEWRKSVLSEAPALSDNEKKTISDLEQHFCFLHVIINLGEYACKNGLMDFDKCALTPESFEAVHLRGQSLTYASIYAAAKSI